MSNNSKFDEKRAAVTGKNKSKAPLIWSFFVALFVAMAAYAVFGGGEVDARKAIAAKTAKGSDIVATQATEFRYPAADFADGEAKFYEYTSKNGLKIRYFIVKSKDGVIRAAFDACDSCWAAGKGYYQKGDVMVCRNCRLTFATNKVNEVKGGCNPSPLKRTMVGDEVIIKASDIEGGSRYFNFNS